MSFLFTAFDYWLEINEKVEKCAIKGLYLPQCQKICFKNKTWNVIHLGMETKLSRWSYILFHNVYHDVVMLHVAWCPLWLVLCYSSLWWTFKGCWCLFSFESEDLRLYLYPGSCDQNWLNKVKIHLRMCITKWIVKMIEFRFVLWLPGKEDCCQTFYPEIPSFGNG